MTQNVDDVLGTPFRYGGRSLAEGALDCYGIVKVLCERDGKQLPERSVSEDHRLIHALMAGQMNVWKLLEGPVEGAVVLIRIKGHACHIGYVLDKFQFIHAWEGSGGAVIERLADWEKRIEGFYEYVG